MKKNKLQSLQSKFFILIAFCAFAVAFTLNRISHNSIVSDKNLYLQDFLYSQSEVINSSINQFVDNAKNSVLFIDRDIRKIKTKEDAQIYLDRFEKVQSQFYEFALFDRKENGSLERLLTHHNDSFFKTIEKSLHSTLKKDSLNFDSTVIKSKEGELSQNFLFSKGVVPRLVLSSRIPKTNQIFVFKFSLQNVIEKAFTTNALEVALANENGDIFLRSHSDLFGENAKSLLEQTKPSDKNSMPAHTNSIASYTISKNNKSKNLTASITKLANLNAYLLIGYDNETAQAVSKSITLKGLLITLLVLACGIFFGAEILKSFHSPYENLLIACDEIIKGNYSHQIKVGKFDELPHLSNKLNQISKKLYELKDSFISSKDSLESVIKSKDNEVISINDFNQKILSNIEEGILLMGHDGIISSSHNHRCIELLEQNPCGKSITNLFPAEEHAGINEWLNNIGNKKAKLEDLLLIGPKSTVTKQGLNLEFKYHLIDSLDSSKKFIMIIISDSTSLNNWESNASHSQSKLETSITILDNQVEFQSFVTYSIDRLKYLKNSKEEPPSTFRRLTKLVIYMNEKAQFFSLNNFSSYLTKNENEFLTRIKSNQEIESVYLNEYINDLLSQITNLARKHALRGGFDHNLNRQFPIALTEIHEFESYVASFDSEALSQNYFSHFLSYKAEQAFVDIHLKLKEFAKNQGVQLEQLVLIGKEHIIPKVRFEKFFIELYEVYENSIIHGRKNSIKITTKIELLEGLVKISVQDDGVGISAKQIKERLKHNNANDFVLAKNDEDIIQHIFDLGFSTKDEISKYGGLGVGLASLKLEINRLGGKYHVFSSQDKGCLFTFSLPFS